MLRTFNYKLVLLGEAAVGKSSTVERFVKNEFFEFQQPTVGAAFITQTVTLNDCIIKFEIWDTAGQERYRSLAPMYYRGAAAALVVYDITDNDSFDGAKTWIEELQRQGSSDIIIAIAGNKLDLDAKREVPTHIAEAFALENDCIFFETSAKQGTNVQEIFHAIAERLPRDQHIPTSNTAFTGVPMENTQQQGGCCK